MVRELISRYSIDAARVYVAGMSAGAAMAINLTRSYPELFAAAAVHSGLPYACANNVVSALAVMKNGHVGRERPFGQARSAVPLIVFHGDHDLTVNHSNADVLVEQTLVDWPPEQPLSTRSTTRFSQGGRDCQRVIYQTADGQVAVDYWTIHGGGHVWSGGNVHGSHTDAMGPNASVEFWRFLSAHRRDISSDL